MFHNIEKNSITLRIFEKVPTVSCMVNNFGKWKLKKKKAA